MKYLLLLAVLTVAFWVWRGRRVNAAQPKPASAQRAPAQPDPMVACRVCDTHLPKADALQGRTGHYCSAEHLRLGEPGS